MTKVFFFSLLALLLLVPFYFVQKPETVASPGTLMVSKSSRAQLELGRFIRETTVRIRAISCGSAKTGSGFVYDGKIITNRHVVRSSDKLEITTWSGRTVGIDLDRSRIYKGLDLAVLRPEKKMPVSADVLAAASIGDKTWVVGYPRGGPEELLPGSILDIYQAKDLPKRYRYNGDTILFSQAINRGSSGGPVFNSKGEVVGVVFAGVFPKAGKPATKGFAFSAKDLLQEISDGKPKKIKPCRK